VGRRAALSGNRPSHDDRTGPSRAPFRFPCRAGARRRQRLPRTYGEAKTARAGNPTLHLIDRWTYQGATHSWETTDGDENCSAKVHWRAKVVGYAASLK
jgi:hypothetical protein